MGVETMADKAGPSRGSAAQFYAAFSGNVDADVTLRLLRSRSAIVYLAMMAARLAGGPVDGDRLAEEIEHDLADLAAHWTDRGFEVPSATELLDRWVREGFVGRTIDTERAGVDHAVERYQLTRGATRALSQIQSVTSDRSMATETVMEMVVGRLGDIAVALNPDPGEHVRSIDSKLAELTQRRRQLADGALPPVDEEKVLDDIRMVAELAERMPADIIGYGEKMRENSRLLLSQNLDGGGHADALNDMFARHDEIAESPEGKAFDAFYTLISDHRLRESLEHHIDGIVTGMREELPDDLAMTLTSFLDRMWAQVQRVDEVRGQVYRRINTFVKDGDVLAYRALREQIAQAQRAAADAFEHASAGKDLGIEVPMSTVESASVGALAFHDGVIDIPDGVEYTVGEMVIDPGDLVGAESIDWAALTDAVNTVAAHGPADLADVVAALPSVRAGDVIGLWSLAHRHGEVSESDEIELVAQTARGPREIRLPAAYFTEPILDDSRSGQQGGPIHLLDGPTSGALA